MIAQEILQFSTRPRTEKLQNLNLNLFKSISTFISWESSGEGFEENAFENFIEDVSRIIKSDISQISDFLTLEKVRGIFDIQDLTTTTTVEPTTTAPTTEFETTTYLITTSTHTQTRNKMHSM